MFRRTLLPAATTTLFLFTLGVAAHDNGHRPFRAFAQLIPTEEVPVVSSDAKGRFRATIDPLNQTISYELSYEGFETRPLQAHIHVGQRVANGGISVFLCGSEGFRPPAPFPQPKDCPPPPATITGELTPADILGPATQGIKPASAANEFDELVAMLRQGLTYANVHTDEVKTGEIRGQVRTDDKRH
jgi:hypothetical protein